MELDFQVALLAQTKVVLNLLALYNIHQTNTNQVHVLQCDVCGEGRANGHYVSMGYAEEAHYAGSFQKSNLYSNTYNLLWKDRPNFKWSSNQCQNFNQEAPHNLPPWFVTICLQV